MNQVNVLELILQYGFAGFSLVVLAILFYVIKHMMIIVKELPEVINNNTKALTESKDAFKALKESIDRLENRMSLSEIKEISYGRSNTSG